MVRQLAIMTDITKACRMAKLCVLNARHARHARHAMNISTNTIHTNITIRTGTGTIHARRARHHSASVTEAHVTDIVTA